MRLSACARKKKKAWDRLVRRRFHRFFAIRELPRHPPAFEGQLLRFAERNRLEQLTPSVVLRRGFVYAQRRITPRITSTMHSIDNSIGRGKYTARSVWGNDRRLPRCLIEVATGTPLEQKPCVVAGGCTGARLSVGNFPRTTKASIQATQPPPLSACVSLGY